MVGTSGEKRAVLVRARRAGARGNSWLLHTPVAAAAPPVPAQLRGPVWGRCIPRERPAVGPGLWGGPGDAAPLAPPTPTPSPRPAAGWGGEEWSKAAATAVKRRSQKQSSSHARQASVPEAHGRRAKGSVTLTLTVTWVPKSQKHAGYRGSLRRSPPPPKKIFEYKKKRTKKWCVGGGGGGPRVCGV